MEVQVILSVIVAMGWMVLGAIFLRRGASPNDWYAREMPSFPRRAFIATGLLLLLVGTDCVFVLKQGLSPSRLVDFLLLRYVEAGFYLQLRPGLGFTYVLYLLALIVPSFLPRDFDEPDRFKMDPQPKLPVDVSDEWKNVCDKFRSRNRRWLIAIAAWLAAMATLAAAGFLGFMNSDAYLYAGALLPMGFVVIVAVSLTLPAILVCPNCGCPPRRRSINLYRWLDEIQECESCLAKLS